MNKLNYIERLKDALRDTDYIAIKASEGCDVSDHGDWKGERQAIRDEINRVETMTEEEFYELYPEENELDIMGEELEGSDEPYDLDVVGNDDSELTMGCVLPR